MRATPLLLIVAALAFPAAAQAAPRGPNLGTMAGYVSDGAPVDSVSATFTVPRIRRGSPDGSFAATWIGAQAPGVNGPFIQIGVNEIHAFLGSKANIYEAFWSDTKLQYHALPIFEVHPGDVIATSLRRRHDGWRLAIVDATTGTARRFDTTNESHGDFNFAEFLQEDPVSVTHGPLPYPHLTKVGFRQLRVDSLPAAHRRHARFLSQWMTTARGDTGPTRVAHGGFTLRRKHLSALASTYARIALPEDRAAYAFDGALAHWTAATPRVEIAAASAHFVAALRVNRRAFMTAHWPPRLLPFVAALVRRTSALAAVVRGAPQRIPADLPAWRAAYDRARRALSEAAGRVHKRTHAPGLL